MKTSSSISNKIEEPFLGRNSTYLIASTRFDYSVPHREADRRYCATEQTNTESSVDGLALIEKHINLGIPTVFGKRRRSSVVSYRASWFDRIAWDLWSAVFFLIASLLFLAQWLIDPDTIYWPLLVELLVELKFSKEQFVKRTRLWSAYLYIFDALINITGWYSVSRCQKQFICADWLLWGEVSFLIGSVVNVYSEYDTRREVGMIGNVIWTFDGFLYVIASSRALKESRKLAKPSVPYQRY